MPDVPHTDEFKRKVVRAFKTRGSKSVDEIASQFGVHRSRLFAWSEKFAAKSKPVTRPIQTTRIPSPPLAELVAREDGEVQRLRQENELLREERDVLKKTIVVFTRPRTR